MLTIFLSLALSLSAQAAPVFFDFSDRPPVKREKLTAAEEAKLGSAILPSYSRDNEHCDGKEGLIEQVEAMNGRFSSASKE